MGYERCPKCKHHHKHEKKCRKRQHFDDIKVHGEAIFKKDVIIDGKLTIPTDITLYVGECEEYPTIQSAVDFFEGRNAGCSTIKIAKGTYEESVKLNKLSSVADLEGTPGLSIIGDERSLAGLTYLQDGHVQLGSQSGDVANVGTWLHRISLSNVGTTITIDVPLGTPPNISADGWGEGDKVLIRDNNGDYHERDIVSTLGNTLTISGTAVAVGDPGSVVIFCPCVVLTPTDFRGYGIALIGCGATVKGIWIKTSASYPGVVGGLTATYNAHLNMGNILVDDRELMMVFGCEAQNNSTLSMLSDGLGDDNDPEQIVQACTLVNPFLGVTARGSSYMGSGAISVFEAFNGILLDEGAYWSAGYSVQAVNNVFVMYVISSGCYFPGVLYTLNCLRSVYVWTQANLILEGRELSPTQSTTEIIGAPLGAIYIEAISTFINVGSILLQDCDLGIFVIGDSTFSDESGGGIQFAGTSVIDRYTTPESKYIDPSLAPNGEFTNTDTTETVLENVFTNQTILGTMPIALELDPSSFLYQGKTFCITSLSAFAHTITLTSGAFFGSGFAGETVATFDGLSANGEFITFLVQNNGNVIVKGVSGVSPTP